MSAADISNRDARMDAVKLALQRNQEATTVNTACSLPEATFSIEHTAEHLPHIARQYKQTEDTNYCGSGCMGGARFLRTMGVNPRGQNILSGPEQLFWHPELLAGPLQDLLAAEGRKNTSHPSKTKSPPWTMETITCFEALKEAVARSPTPRPSICRLY